MPIEIWEAHVGAGAKAFLSYQSSYTYRCRKDGVERMFLIFKGAQYPESSMLYEKPCEEANGVEVRVLLKAVWGEKENCIRHIREQLSYLPNVYFDVPGLENSYKIHQYEDFYYNSLYSGDKMHIALKGVYYPIDWADLGITPINVPVALRFDSYDAVMPIFNRESIQMDTLAREAIKAKIGRVATWMFGQYNLDVKEMPLSELLDKFHRLAPAKEWKIGVADRELTITALEQYSDLKPAKVSVEGIDIPAADLWELRRFFGNYEVVGAYTTKFSTYKDGKSLFEMERELGSRYNRFVIQDIPKGKQREYIREEYSDLCFYFCRHIGERNLYHYKNLLDLVKYPKEKWRKIIQDFQTINGLFDAKVIPFDEYIVPKEWRSRKVKRQYKNGRVVAGKKKNEITVRKFSGRRLYGKEKVSIEELAAQHSLPIIYGAGNGDMYNWSELLPCYVVTEADCRKLERVKGYYTVDEIPSLDLPVFKEIAIQNRLWELYHDDRDDYSHDEMEQVLEFLKAIEHPKYDEFKVVDTGDMNRSNHVIVEMGRKANWWNAPILKSVDRFHKWVRKNNFDFLDNFEMWKSRDVALAKEFFYYRTKCKYKPDAGTSNKAEGV